MKRFSALQESSLPGRREKRRKATSTALQQEDLPAQTKAVELVTGLPRLPGSGLSCGGVNPSMSEDGPGEFTQHRVPASLPTSHDTSQTMLLNETSSSSGLEAEHLRVFETQPSCGTKTESEESETLAALKSTESNGHEAPLAIRRSDLEKCFVQNMHVLLEGGPQNSPAHNQSEALLRHALNTTRHIEAAKQLVQHLNQSIQNDQITLPGLIARAVELQRPCDHEPNSPEFDRESLRGRIKLAEKAIVRRQESIRTDQKQLREVQTVIESLWQQLRSILQEAYGMVKDTVVAR